MTTSHLSLSPPEKKNHESAKNKSKNTKKYHDFEAFRVFCLVFVFSLAFGLLYLWHLSQLPRTGWTNQKKIKKTLKTAEIRKKDHVLRRFSRFLSLFRVFVIVCSCLVFQLG